MDQIKAKELLLYKEKADDAYFNSDKPIMTDDDYDALCKQLESFNVVENKIGCIPKENKVKLPIFMGSLTKYNNNKTIKNFKDKFNHESYIVQEKLDGVSCLYVFENGKVELYTRGNGSIGTNITYLLDYGLNIPKMINDIQLEKSSFVMVRGELIMKRNIFLQFFYPSFKNIRNMVSGQVNKNIPDRDIVSKLDFVAYEVIEPHLEYQKPLLEQYKFLQKNKFMVISNHTIEQELVEQEVLMDYLNRKKKKSKYDIDGLVVTIIKKYKRNDSGNPKYSFAFKIQGEVSEAKVEHVKWNLSKTGKYKPQIFIKPVELGGVTISSLTGFNAKYVVDNNIVKDTILSITRSGDVIPHILTVLHPGNGSPILPENSKWDSVDLYYDESNHKYIPDDIIIKQMVFFFTSLNCTYCKEKTIIKLYEAGYKTIESIVEAQVEDLIKINGFGKLKAINILESIQSKVREASIHELLSALICFGGGIGLKKIQNINLNSPYNLKVKGLSETTIKEKIIPNWENGINRVVNLKKLVNEDVDILNLIEEEKFNGPFKDKVFVFTGFRDAALEKQLIDLGAKVTSSISKNTTDLIVACNQTKNSSKFIKAQHLGIQTTTKLDLIFKVKEALKTVIKSEVDYDHYSSSDSD